MIAYAASLVKSGAQNSTSEQIDGGATTRVRILLGRYQLDTVIGCGGMGSVYRALDLQEGRECAVKVLSLGAIETSDASRRRFAREASIVARLSHANIVEIYDFGYAEDGSPFLVMELLRGRDLFHIIQRHRRLPLSDVQEILRQVGSALEAMHSIGIIHRDVKPQNVFVCKGTRSQKSLSARPVPLIKLVDFGLSTPIGADELTTAGSIIGTLEYLAPEGTYGKSQALDTFSDQWSLGVMAYRLLCGQLPFEADNWIGLATRIREAHPVPLPERNPTLPPHVCVAIHRALSLQKRDRYPSIAEFVRALSVEVPVHCEPSQAPSVKEDVGVASVQQPGTVSAQPATTHPISWALGMPRAVSQRSLLLRTRLLHTFGVALAICSIALAIHYYLNQSTLTQVFPETLTLAARMLPHAMGSPVSPDAFHSRTSQPRIVQPPLHVLLPLSSQKAVRTSSVPSPRTVSSANRPHTRVTRPAARAGAFQNETFPAPLTSLEAVPEEEETEDVPAEPANPEAATLTAQPSGLQSNSTPARVAHAVATSYHLSACGERPRLPPEIRQAMRGSTVSGTYQLCIDKSGKVSSARAVRGIPGADEAILSTVRAWRCPPWPVPVCAPLELEFILE